jgi:hypothetical protein
MRSRMTPSAETTVVTKVIIAAPPPRFTPRPSWRKRRFARARRYSMKTVLSLPLFDPRHRWSLPARDTVIEYPNMFKLITTMRRGSATDLAAAWARYPTVEAARLGIATLLRDDRILRVMIVRNEIPPAFVEWVER